MRLSTSISQTVKALRWPLAFAWTALIIYFSFQHGSPNSPPPPFPHFDKVMHFTFYGVLGGLWFWALPHHHKTLLVFAFIALLGAADEIHQGYVPYRDTSFFDWIADLCGVWFALVIHKRVRRAPLS